MHLPGFGLEHSLEWPRIQLAETDQHFKLTAELPGLEPSDVQVLLTDRTVTIRGEKRLDQRDPQQLPGAERFFGRFERQVPLPSPIHEDSVTASFKDGVLCLVMVKTTDSRPQRIAVDE